jgi:uncharacterized protein with NRDE domain
MCLVALAWRATPAYPLLLAANRDERHDRPTLAAHWWSDLPDVLGGRDLRANGSWLAVDRRGRLAAVTNFRDPTAQPARLSRGALVAAFLSQPGPPAEFAAGIEPLAHDYGPFNLLLLGGDELRYASNRAPPASFAPGVRVLSNAALEDDWPKTRSARAALQTALTVESPETALFELLARRSNVPPPEGYRSAHFIEGPLYGTRSSTVITIDAGGRLNFVERTFDAETRLTGEVRESFLLPRSRGSAPRESL